MWVGWNTPITLPSGPIPFLLKVKISCMLMTFSSMPVISETLVTLRDAIAQARGLNDDSDGRRYLLANGFFRNIHLPIATIDSSLEMASRGVLA